MNSTLEPAEIKRVKLHTVKCPKCKANLMIKPTEKVCPVCGGSLPTRSLPVALDAQNLNLKRKRVGSSHALCKYQSN